MDCSLASKLNQLSVLKLKAIEEGAKCRVIQQRDIPESFRGGNYAEIAICGVLGRIDEFYRKFHNVDLNITFDSVEDMKGKDLILCGKPLNIKSKYLMQNNMERYPNDVITVYNYPGFKNFLEVMKFIDEVHYVPDYLVRDINYIWEMYMSFSTLKNNSNGIIYKNKSGRELDSFKLYVSEIDSEIIPRINKELAAFKERRKTESVVIDLKEVSTITNENSNGGTKMGEIAIASLNSITLLNDEELYTIKTLSMLTGIPIHRWYTIFKQIPTETIIEKGRKVSVTKGSTIKGNIKKIFNNNHSTKTPPEAEKSNETTLDVKNRAIRRRIFQEVMEVNAIDENSVFLRLSSDMFKSDNEIAALKHINNDLVEVIALVYPQKLNILDYIRFDENENCELFNFKDEVLNYFNEETIIGVEKGDIEEIFFKGVLELKQFGGSLYRFVSSVFPDIDKSKMKNKSLDDYTSDDFKTMIDNAILKDHQNKEKILNFLINLD